MVSDTLAGDQQLGMALLQPGWEESYYEGPEVFEIGGMGRITDCELLDEGKYDIVLEGSTRYRIVQFVQDSPYRVAQVRPLVEVIPSQEVTQELAAELMLCFQEVTEIGEPVLALDILENLDFTTMVNSICSVMSVSAYDKQYLLELGDVKRRAENLLDVFRRQVSQKRFASRFRHLQPEDPGLN